MVAQCLHDTVWCLRRNGDEDRHGDVDGRGGARFAGRGLDGLRQRLGIDDSVKGVAVVDMLPPKGDDKRPHAGPGPELRPGDVIEQVAGTAVDRPSQVTALIDEARARKRDHILLLVAQGNESRFVAVEIK